MTKVGVMKDSQVDGVICCCRENSSSNLLNLITLGSLFSSVGKLKLSVIVICFCQQQVFQIIQQFYQKSSTHDIPSMNGGL